MHGLYLTYAETAAYTAKTAITGRAGLRKSLRPTAGDSCWWPYSATIQRCRFGVRLAQGLVVGHGFSMGQRVLHGKYGEG